MEKPKYYELVDALVGMACQYMEDEHGMLNDDCVSAGEDALDILNRLGVVDGRRLVKEAFDIRWIKARFSDKRR